MIWPYEEEYLSVVPGSDIITLLTCYHQTSSNDRLLVFAERFYPEDEASKEQPKGAEKPVESPGREDSFTYLQEIQLGERPWYKKPQSLVAAFAVILVIMFLTTIFRKNSR